MQTFLPSADLRKGFRQLDYKRLGKQRVEAMQIINIIANANPDIGWASHTCIPMWRPYALYLCYYKDLCIEEWIRRGYVNNMPFTSTVWLRKGFEFHEKNKPWWMGLKKLHSSHRATLLFKNYDHYKQFGWQEEPKYEYWWPNKRKLK